MKGIFGIVVVVLLAATLVAVNLPSSDLPPEEAVVQCGGYTPFQPVRNYFRWLKARRTENVQRFRDGRLPLMFPLLRRGAAC